jgi:REP element-mobilizing transposase RayT
MSTSQLPSRRSIRLQDFDYRTSGVYFFTICTPLRKDIFGGIADEKMILNAEGEMVWETWHKLPQHYPTVQLDAFVVMPNHVHGVIALHRQSPQRAGLRPAPTLEAPSAVEAHHAAAIRKAPSLANIVGSLKSFSARRIHRARGTSQAPVWQRGYFGRIVRTGEELTAIQQYIAENPARWSWDRENPSAGAELDAFAWESKP